ncbi:SOS response-associated peptidase [Kordiimonas sp.]|uniref:SOS response-associated peptidase n=1 Tax=Kordiimonas sp. TaxID=1970157 RepID=UPI003A90657B
MKLDEPPTWAELHRYYSTFSGPQFAKERTPGDVAPTDTAPIVVLHKGQRRLTQGRWWMVPRWQTELKQGSHHMFNCRDDNLIVAYNRYQKNRGTYGPFVEPFARGRRCLIPVNGYYEYDNGRPILFHMNDKSLFAIAGIWDWNQNVKTPEWPKGVISFTMITTEPTRAAALFHNRMPVILHPSDYTRWLNPETLIEDAIRLLRPYKYRGLTITPQEIEADRQYGLFGT